MFRKFCFFGIVLIFLNVFSASGLLLCKTFSYSYTLSKNSNSDGWGHLYTWTVQYPDPIPHCANYSVTITQWSGDNDGDWWHSKTQTYTATLTAGTQIYANGQVQQVTANNCLGNCPWYVKSQLYVGGTLVASLSDAGTTNTERDTDIDRGRIQIDVARI